MSKQRKIIISWYPTPDSCWVAECPEKLGLTAWGGDEETALREFLEAEKAWDKEGKGCLQDGMQ